MIKQTILDLIGAHSNTIQRVIQNNRYILE